jgi:hypothetical protein
MFITKRGGLVRGYSTEEFQLLIQRSEDLGVSMIQMAEAASYSFAMVARSSLGLSCKDASITAIVTDSFPGCVALGTLRHLFNNGSTGKVFLLGATLEAVGADLASFIQPLISCGLLVQPCTGFADIALLRTAVESSHTILSGCTEINLTKQHLKDVTDLLNELSTPIHSVLTPLGVHGDTGVAPDPVYSATTLSLGVPLMGLESAREAVGRHYLCDLSIPRKVFDDRQEDLTDLFSEQPITQIYIESEVRKLEKQ